MKEEEFQELLELGHELSGIEFKGPGSRSDKPFFAKVARAALGMSNRRDGGRVVIGVGQDASGAPTPLGLSKKEVATWDYDSLADSLDEIADPNVIFEVVPVNHDGKDFVVIEVAEFADIPVLCSRNYQSILRRGACYVRPRRKPETSEIATQEDMRDLLDLATKKRLRKFLEQAAAVGFPIVRLAKLGDSDLFDEQKSGFLGE